MRTYLVVIDETPEAEVALRFAAAERYDAERSEVLAVLQGFGILTLDVPAQQFPVALANRYLDIKAAGRL